MKRGKLLSVEDFGTIVVMSIELSDGEIYRVYWDHRQFQHFADENELHPNLEVETDGETVTVLD